MGNIVIHELGVLRTQVLLHNFNLAQYLIIPTNLPILSLTDSFPLYIFLKWFVKIKGSVFNSVNASVSISCDSQRGFDIVNFYFHSVQD